MNAATRIRGLYAITPDTPDTTSLVAKTRAALAGGARVLQYRNKSDDPALRREQGQALLALCRDAGAAFIVNDDLSLALELDADGVHLGEHDGDLAAARRALGPGKLLGASCYNELTLGQRALAQGADHIAFGAAFTSSTKPGARRAPLELYKNASALGAPVVAIGGITPGNAKPLIDAGVAAIAVISALYDAPDVRAAAQQFAAFFVENRA
jgi:thiamine-phosphate pyrophosphorylase